MLVHLLPSTAIRTFCQVENKTVQNHRRKSSSHLCVRVRPYRCGSAGELPGILLSGTGLHTGHKRWLSHQLHKQREDLDELFPFHLDF